jgi:molybdopterin molybdotransferase
VITLDAARAAVLDAVAPLDAIDVALADGAGLVLAADVRAGAPVPPFANSSMDGYALRAADSGATLRVVGAVLAGDAPTLSVAAGEAARIMTGAMVPDGADAVCPIEVVEVLDAGSAVRVPVARAGDYVRAVGSDVAVGDALAGAGELLTPARLGVLAAQGLATLRVVPRPVVGVVSTGDELAGGPGALAPGQIHDVNRPVLLAALAAAGYDARDLGAVGDDAAAIAERLAEGASSCDAVISTGGVSVGDVDFVKTVLAEVCGGHAQWMQVAVRPGKPFAFGVAGATPLFGLAGNPVSTLASFELLVRPALAKRAGRAPAPARFARLDVDLAREPDGRLHAVPVTCAGDGAGGARVVAAAPGGSHQLGRVVGSNALALVPDGPGLAVGDVVEVVALAGAPWPA